MYPKDISSSLNAAQANQKFGHQSGVVCALYFHHLSFHVH